MPHCICGQLIILLQYFSYFHVSEVCLYVILINTLAFNRAVRDESPWSHPICILQGDPTCNDISY